jgi:hypothetical protein
MPIDTIGDALETEDSSNSDINTDDQGKTAAEEQIEILGDPIESADLISTTEFAVPVKNDETGDDAKSDLDDSDKGTDGNKDEDKDKPDTTKIDQTFADSPRFQELNRQKNDAVQAKLQAEAGYNALKDQVNTLTELVKGLGGKPTASKDPGFKNVLAMTDEAIIEGFESNPKGFLANFAQQILHEADGRLTGRTQKQREQTEREQQEQAINDLYADYESKNPDFVEMWEKQEIQKFMAENPGNTPISAHQIIKSTNLKSSMESSQEEAIKIAVEKAVAEATKKFKAKSLSRTIGAGPSGGARSVTRGIPADLANTKEHGGLTNVLVERSLARERARANGQ